MKIKFVQTGDFHLDCPLRSFENSDLRRAELLSSIDEIFKFIKDNSVNILFLTGDIFDSEFLRKDTLEYLKRKFSGVSETKIYISPGNHDYIGRNISYIKGLGSNVHVFNKMERVPYNDKINIYGAGFFQRNNSESLIPDSYFPERNKFNFLVLHGDVARNSNYNPIKVEDLKRFQYAALGHRHDFCDLKYGIYAGAPYARSFNEKLDKGFIFGTLDTMNSSIETSFIVLKNRSYRDFNLNIEDTEKTFFNNSLDNEKILILVEDLLSGTDYRDIIRINISGNFDIHSVNWDFIKNALSRYEYLEFNLKEADYLDYGYPEENSVTGRYLNSFKEEEFYSLLSQYEDSVNDKLKQCSLEELPMSITPDDRTFLESLRTKALNNGIKALLGRKL